MILVWSLIYIKVSYKTSLRLEEYSFKEFDNLAHWFWTFPIEKRNKKILEGQSKDKENRPGVTLVAGTPLPNNIQKGIYKIQKAFDEYLNSGQLDNEVIWREDFDALHLTVYGLIKPEDYKRDVSWPLDESTLIKLRNILSVCDKITLNLKGVGILGGGAIAIRISDNKTLSNTRECIEKIDGISEYRRRAGESVNKIVIGRFKREFQERQFFKLCKIVNQLKKYQVGFLHVEHYRVIHYKHEFLDKINSQFLLC